MLDCAPEFESVRLPPPPPFPPVMRGVGCEPLNPVYTRLTSPARHASLHEHRAAARHLLRQHPRNLGHAGAVQLVMLIEVIGLKHVRPPPAQGDFDPNRQRDRFAIGTAIWIGPLVIDAESMPAGL